MTKQPSVKILVGYHKPAVLLKSDVLVPIHLGRALATKASKDGAMSQEDYQWMLDNMIGDDTGDNISNLNREFCELTAIYWAWKNYDKLGNPDYIGFMHYRRHFIFNENLNEYYKNEFGLYEIKNITKDYINNIKLNDKDINSFIKKTFADFYITRKIKTLYSVKEHFCKDLSFLNSQDLEKCAQEIISNYPKYKETVTNYLNSNSNYWYGSFIMRKDLFFEYCDWLFNILFKLEKKINRKNYSVQSNRILAFLAERLLGIFYVHKQNILKYELDMSFIKKTEINLSIKPRQIENNIALCFCCNRDYFPYLTVTLQSIIANKTDDNIYDITILHTDELPEQCDVLKYVYRKENIYIRFFNISSIVQKYNNIFFTSDHLSIEAYYRFFIPEIFKYYDKVIYLDSDLIVNRDIAELYKIDIKNNLIGACNDIEVIRFYIRNNLKEYLLKTLNLENYSSYFNSGVIIFNIKECLKFNITDKLLNKLKQIKTPKFWDQDIFNCVCEHQVYELDQSWNTQWQPYISEMNQALFQVPQKVYEKYIQALKERYIIHYTSPIKPWSNPEFPLAYFWWKYARMTPFYEEIIYKNLYKCKNLPQSSLGNSALLIKDVFQRHKITFKYLKYKIFSKITFGKLHKKYKQKKNEMKARLKAVKRFLKGK